MSVALALPLIRGICSWVRPPFLFGQRKLRRFAIQGEFVINPVLLRANPSLSPSRDVNPYLHWSPTTLVTLAS